MNKFDDFFLIYVKENEDDPVAEFRTLAFSWEEMYEKVQKLADIGDETKQNREPKYRFIHYLHLVKGKSGDDGTYTFRHGNTIWVGIDSEKP